MTAKTKFNPTKSNFPSPSITSVGGKLKAFALGTSVALLASLTPFLVPAANARTTQEVIPLLHQVYCRVLERPVDEAALIDHGNALKGNKSVKDLIYDLVTSDEHKNKFYDDDNLTNSVIKLYDHLLAREPDNAGLRLTRQKMREPNGGYESAVRGLIDSKEYNDNFGNDKVPGNGRGGCQ
jgi:hypothetical protein